MQKNIKRIISLFLALALCFSAIPLSAFAAETSPDDVVSSEEAEGNYLEESTPPEETPSPEQTAKPQEQPEVISEESSPFETEGSEVDVTKIWPSSMRRAAAALSVGAS